LAVALRDLRRNAEADACEQRAATIRSQTSQGEPATAKSDNK
jgi:hypothetical protein